MSENTATNAFINFANTPEGATLCQNALVLGATMLNNMVQEKAEAENTANVGSILAGMAAIAGAALGSLIICDKIKALKRERNELREELEATQSRLRNLKRASDRTQAPTSRREDRGWTFPGDRKNAAA